MLLSLVINNFILFDQQEVSFTEKFISISGETGAGKSLFVKSLLFVLGEKVDFFVVNRKKDTSVSAYFCFSSTNNEVNDLLKENNIDFDQENLIIKRVLTVDNKNKIFINDNIATLNLLKKLSNLICEVHSQNKQVIAFEPNFCLNILDRLAGNEELLQLVKEVYDSYKRIEKEIKASEAEYHILHAEIDFIKNSLKDFEKFNFLPGEEEELIDKKKNFSINLAKGKLLGNIKDFVASDDLTHSLLKMQKELSKYTDLIDINNSLEQLVNYLDQVTNQIDLIQNYDDDQFDLAIIEEKLSKIKEMCRKNKCTYEELLNLKDKLINQLNDFENFSFKLDNLNKNKKQIFEQLINYSDALSITRKNASLILEKRIADEFKELYLDKADFKVDFKQLNDLEITSKGFDVINFLIKTNSGFDYAPVKSIASGGELSRIMLAIKVSLIFDEQKSLIIFDEIDSGTSGNIAKAIAKKIENLSHSIQVITISHNPQMFELAKQNLVVSKTDIEGKTVAFIKDLTLEEKNSSYLHMKNIDREI